MISIIGIPLDENSSFLRVQQFSLLLRFMSQEGFRIKSDIPVESAQASWNPVK